MATSEPLDTLLAEAEEQVKAFGNESAEVIQHLRDLGYLASLPFDEHHRGSVLKEALSHFEQDFLEADFFSQADVESLKAMYQEAFAEEMLRKLMELDEGLPIKKMPMTGELNLISRVIHYRLAMYGLYPLKASSHFGFTSISGIQTLKHHLALSTPLEAVNLLADKEGVLKRILSIYGNERCLMFLHVDKQQFKTLNFDPKKTSIIEGLLSSIKSRF